jgi:hypothetical protein
MRRVACIVSLLTSAVGVCFRSSTRTAQQSFSRRARCSRTSKPRPRGSRRARLTSACEGRLGDTHSAQPLHCAAPALDRIARACHAYLTHSFRVAAAQPRGRARRSTRCGRHDCDRWQHAAAHARARDRIRVQSAQCSAVHAPLRSKFLSTIIIQIYKKVIKTFRVSRFDGYCGVTRGGGPIACPHSA